MLIEVKVVPRAKKSRIREENGIYKVYTPAPAVDNQANLAVVEMLAGFFQVKPSRVRIKKGTKNRHKVVEILDA